MLNGGGGVVVTCFFDFSCVCFFWGGRGMFLLFSFFCFISSPVMFVVHGQNFVVHVSGVN